LYKKFNKKFNKNLIKNLVIENENKNLKEKRDNYIEQLNSIEINFFEEKIFYLDEYEILNMKDSNDELNLNENFKENENKIKIKFENTLKDLINSYNNNNYKNKKGN
jgi:hypothetical protein